MIPVTAKPPIDDAKIIAAEILDLLPADSASPRIRELVNRLADSNAAMRRKIDAEKQKRINAAIKRRKTIEENYRRRQMEEI